MNTISNFPKSINDDKRRKKNNKMNMDTSIYYMHVHMPDQYITKVRILNGFMISKYDFTSRFKLVYIKLFIKYLHVMIKIATNCTCT